MIKSECSYGTSGIINGLLSSYNKKFLWNVIFVNIMTLIRNCHEKNTQINQLLNKLKIDIENINFHAGLYADNRYEIHIIYYWPKYSNAISEDILRKKNNKNLQIQTLYEKIYDIFYKYFGGSKTSHIQLFDILFSQSRWKKIDSSITDPSVIPIISLFRRYKSIGKIRPVLISHIELDYHIKEFFYNTNILNSFSGKLLESNIDISNKVFKINSIRFNKYSHYLFGDSTLIKSNLSIRDKRRLKEISKVENWGTLTNASLLKKLIANNFLNKKAFNFNIY